MHAKALPLVHTHTHTHTHTWPPHKAYHITALTLRDCYFV